MILNVSGRTDIVAFYMDWFLNRIEEGYFLVRNPFYKTLVHKINYEDVDLIVFCTKNPANLLKNIDKITKPFIVHITLTPYGTDIEPNVPNKETTIEIIKKLSNLIGSDKIFIRYDPIFINDKYTVDYHIKSFENITSALEGYTKTIIVSFIDEYKNVLKNMDILQIQEPTESDYEAIGVSFAKSASNHDMTVQTCAEERTLFEYGFIQADCVTEDLVEHFTGKRVTEKWTSRNNKNCNCIHMYDIGEYSTCKHYCKYCYANFSEQYIELNSRMHDKTSPLLIGTLKDNDTIKEIKNNSVDKPSV